MLSERLFPGPLYSDYAWSPAFYRLRLNGALVVALIAFFAFKGFSAESFVPAEYPPVSPVPESFFKLVREADRETARQFYKKHIDVQGMPVVASAEVADLALQRTYDIVTHLLAGRPDVIQAMVKNGMYLIIIGKDQVYTDMPEYRHHPNPAYQNERVRGTGGKPTSFGEENLLSLPIDRYDDESIGVHEFCHTIDGTLRSIDPAWSERKNAIYRHAMDKGLWKNTYAASNPTEFWAEVCQSYFDCNRINNWNHGPIGTRAQLQAYDPESYEVVRSTFRLSPEQDWHYRWLQKLPNVGPPPARFKVDPYYTKFTWAREFTVVGRQASDDALLKANDVIRKMFAYRHDILKALIADGARLVVLGKTEKIVDLPEYGRLKESSVSPEARAADYTPASKLMVLGEEAFLNASDSSKGEDRLIRVFAKAFYELTGRRPVDPNWNDRGRDVQQYELRVERLDIRFGEKVDQSYAAATSRGLWKSTPAERSRAEYWAQGVAAYFSAVSGNGNVPAGTRERLKEYDPGLYALVHETMAYEGHQDWRYDVAK